MTTTLDKIRRKAAPVIPSFTDQIKGAPSAPVVPPVQNAATPAPPLPHTQPKPTAEVKAPEPQQVPPVVKTKQAEQDKNITADVHYRTGDTKTDAYIDSEIERTDPSRPGYQKPTDYTGFIQRMKAGEVPTPEQRLKEAKRRKREALISAIGDGISAMSNLYFTTKDAPNAYDPKDSLSAKSYARWQQLKDQRKKDKDAYEAALLNAKTMDDASMNNERNYRQRLLAMRNQQQHYDRNYALQVQKMQEEASRRAQERQDKLDQQGIENERENKKMGETQRHNKRMEGAAYLRANNAGKRSSKAHEDHVIGVHYGYQGYSENLRIPKEAWNESNIKKAYHLLNGPKTVEEIREDEYGDQRKVVRNPSKEYMEQYIGEMLEMNAQGKGSNKNIQNAYRFLKSISSGESNRPDGSRPNAKPSDDKDLTGLWDDEDTEDEKDLTSLF